MQLAVSPTQGFGIILKCIVLNTADQISFILNDSLYHGLGAVFLLQVPAEPLCITVVRDAARGFHCTALVKLNHVSPEMPALPVASVSLPGLNVFCRSHS